MQLKLPLATLGAALLMWSGPLVAQAGCSIDASGPTSCTAAHSLQADVNYVATLDLSTDVTQFTVTAADYSAPKHAFGPGVAVSSNTVWSLSVASLTALWSGGDNDKPSTDLEFSYNGGAFTQITTTPTTLASGGPGVFSSVPTDLQTTWSFTDDPPGTYALGLVFTLTAP